MPRFTYAPSGMWRATRAAIWSRAKRCIEASSIRGRCLAGCLRLGQCAGRQLDDALDEDSGRDNRFRIETAEVDGLAHLRDRALRRGRHDRTEVPRRLAIDEVPPAVAAVGLDQRDVGVDRMLEHVLPAIDLPRLLAFGEQRAVTGRAEERADACAGGANALGQVALRHQLELDLA